VWPGAAMLVAAAPQVVYLSARLGFELTLRDDGQPWHYNLRYETIT
jgi:hypothetical protein